MTVKISPKVFQQFLDARDASDVNMFDKKGVQVVADRIGAYELVIWLEDVSNTDYVALIYGDFEETEDV